MSVASAQREIDSREFAEWMAYYQLEPFGEERADLRSGIVASTMANAFRGKNQRAFKLADFMPKFDGKGQDQKAAKAKVVNQLQAFARAHNAAMKGRKGKSQP